MKGVADGELFELIKQSDYAAFTELYERHWKYIYEMAYRKTADKDDAFDLTQNVFIEFYDKRQSLIINIPVRNYLRTALIFKISNYFRSRGFKEKHYNNFRQFLEQSQQTEHVLDTMEIKESDAQFEELVGLIYATIDEMPEKMKTVFLLSRTEKYTINEIAAQLGLSPQTVKNQVSKALSRIRIAAASRSVSVTQLLLVVWLTKY